jgi:hypothetical protein
MLVVAAISAFDLISVAAECGEKPVLSEIAEK